ncbi:hypothetical protein FISHEDRAFT_39898 [Fistulina hepatica ATCC 64428]|uniref:RNA-binding protein vts1-like alpha-helical domain-containing protein n=1 Tax=Fistulina hepatica ATCC 64428 TaxID=1128425 RepID=A0A0D7AGG7_9AGAR|nr:hypothetical protein FISHEDRAFT_39898 [Fistulina hepatica ATCC 64428]
MCSCFCILFYVIDVVCVGFTVLAEAERTATVYALMQHSSPTQIRFFAAILQEMIEADNLNEIHCAFTSDNFSLLLLMFSCRQHPWRHL